VVPVGTQTGRGVIRPRPNRSVHPLAWWGWAACLAVSAMQTTNPNPFLLLLLGAVACFVVATCRGSDPWSRSLAFFLRIGAVVIVIRVVIEIFFGQRGVPGHVLFTMPHVPLPSWAAAVSIGGAVTLESIVTAAVLGLQIAVILVCFGAANSLVSPYRLLRCLPAVLYEAGVAVTVALSFTPELVQTIGSVRQARRMRGIPTSGLRGLRGIAVPVLEGALDRSLQLATSMDARGYGRRGDAHRTARTLATAATVGGLLLAAVGVYGITDAGSEFGLGLPLMATAGVLCAIGFAARGRRLQRSRYRPDRWGAVEWLIVGSGLVALGTMILAHSLRIPGMVVSFVPLAVPSLPVLPVVGILVATLPALVVPARRVVAASPRRELEAMVAT
jgi:energy-coupling factor transport system permease protein